MSVIFIILYTEILKFKCGLDYLQEKASKKEKAAVDGVFFR